MSNCKNCGSELTGKYCSGCGQPAIAKRIDGHYIIHEIQHVLHFEKGILFTVKELLVRPGQNVRKFIAEDRSKLVKPIIFVIVTSLLYTLINHFFHFEEGYINISGDTKKSSASLIAAWVQDHYGYANIIMGIFIAFWLKLFFKKYNYNFFEILILLCFVMGMGMLIFSIAALIQGVTHLDTTKVAGVVGLLYCIWAIAQFFDGKKWLNYLKSLVSYLLGMATFSASTILLGLVIDSIVKH